MIYDLRFTIGTIGPAHSPAVHSLAVHSLAVHSLAFVLCVLCGYNSFAADKIHIVVPASYTGDAAVSRQTLTLTPIAPLPRVYYTNVFSRQPIGRATDTNGVCTFSNILWGYYRLDIPGAPGTSFQLSVGTNLTGLVNVAVLITNPATLPPNPATNYYTQAQVDALLAAAVGGGGTFDFLALSNTPPAAINNQDGEGTNTTLYAPILPVEGVPFPLNNAITWLVLAGNGEVWQTRDGHTLTNVLADTLRTARSIGNISFDGSASIVPQTIQVAADTPSSVNYVAFFDSATGNQQPKTDTGLTYNSSTAGLAAGGFVGPLTGNADSATLASTVTVVDSTDATSFIAMFDSAIGSLAAKTDGALTYDATSGALSATSFSGSGVNLTALNAANLGSGTIPDARFPATLPAASGVNLTALNAANLASGTIPDARFPATLPAASGVNLTALNAANLASGTIPDARFPATLPAANAAALTGYQGTNLVNTVKGAFSTNYTVIATDQILACTGTNQLLTLQNGTNGVSAGRIVAFLMSSTTGYGSAIITNANGFQTVLTAAGLSQTITNGQSLVLIWDGANWR